MPGGARFKPGTPGQAFLGRQAGAAYRSPNYGGGDPGAVRYARIADRGSP